jgi:hypothetical protein
MSQSESWLLDLAGNIAQGIGARTNEAIGKVFEETEGFDGLDVSFVQIGYAFLPDPITPASYIARGPYTDPNIYKQRMEEAVERGWLEAIGEDQYALSEKSKEWAKKFLAKGDEFFGTVPMLSEEETKRLIELLTKFVKQANKMPDVGDLPTLQIGLNLEPPPDAHLMTRLRRKITNLFYFRDDIHIVAWQPYDVDGKTWETLTFLWRDEAATGEEMAKKVGEYRNYKAEDYDAAFNKLVTRGWATAENGKYLITDQGKNTRQEAEDVTDQLFYAPVKAFTEDEKKELKSLLEKMAEVVKLPEEEAEPA